MDFTWKIGGAQGEGIDSAGEIFALTLHRKGYYIYAYRHFMSLIKGGHTNYKVRISSKQHRHRGDQLDLLVAFDQRSIDENLHELKSGGAVLYNAGAFEPKFPADVDVVPIGVPMQQIAKDHGSIVMTNMAAMGAYAPRWSGLDPTPSTTSSPSATASTATTWWRPTARWCGPASTARHARPPTGAAACPSCPEAPRARSASSSTATTPRPGRRRRRAAASWRPTPSPRPRTSSTACSSCCPSTAAWCSRPRTRWPRARWRSAATTPACGR